MLYGVSRGAIASAVVAADEPRLRGLILIGGVYDLAAAWPALPAGIKHNVREEAGTSAEAFAARSALFVAGRIGTLVLILHGRRDANSPPDQAEKFAAALRDHGTNVALNWFDSGHIIPFKDRARAIEPFLQEILESRK
ncbi:alpha/beta hydrolase family protein [Microvirga rosea]|uniref:alpha/beta hydrolase family protein n=1 Tax=Microvirga rosea TaxID=2715425 RepID=UPI0038730043